MQVAGLVTVPGGSWVVTWSFLGFQGSECMWQDLLQHLEEVGVETRSSGSFQGLSTGGRTCCNTWRKLRRRLGLVEAFRGQSSGGRICYKTWMKLVCQQGLVEAARDSIAGCRTCYSTWRKLG